jgi:hypothetical protein
MHYILFANKAYIRIIHKDEFIKEWDWMVFTKSITIRAVVKELRQSKFLNRGESIFVPKEGVHVNSPKFFFLSNEKWNVKEKTKTLLKIKNSYSYFIQ